MLCRRSINCEIRIISKKKNIEFLECKLVASISNRQILEIDWDIRIFLNSTP